MHLTAPEVSRHKCLIYEGHPSEQLPVVIPFLAEGLEGNWRCLYLGSPEMVQMVEGSLRRHGIDTISEMKRGALLLSSERGHLQNGPFDPLMMINGLRELVDGAVQDGFEGLCATGDMRWELGPDDNFDRLIEYEALLEQLFREKPLIGICQYHRDTIPPGTLKDALTTHRSTYIGDALNRDNLFYIPPEVLLESSDEPPEFKHGEWMCQQIVRVLKAERTRDKALSALEEMNRSLEQRIKERTEQLETANRELEAFSYSVSHDLRAPLQQIVGFAGLIKQDVAASLSPTAKNNLDRIEDGILEMRKRIDDLLRLAKFSRVELRLARTDLTAMAVDISRNLRCEDPNRAGHFEIQGDISVQCDPGLLRIVLENLLSNAWKYTAKKEHAAIEFGSIAISGETRYFVRDNGVGFDSKYADELFAPFRRLHSAKEFKGHGVGLATVHRIINRHGGRVWAEAKLNEGAVFYFTLGIDVVRK